MTIFFTCQNVLSVEEVTFLLNKAPCLKALEIQWLLQNSGVGSFLSKFQVVPQTLKNVKQIDLGRFC